MWRKKYKKHYIRNSSLDLLRMKTELLYNKKINDYMYIASFHKYYIRALILNFADANLSIFNEGLSSYFSDSSNFYQSIFNGTQ